MPLFSNWFSSEKQQFTTEPMQMPDSAQAAAPQSIRRRSTDPFHPRGTRDYQWRRYMGASFSQNRATEGGANPVNRRPSGQTS
ncbi:uncharacterized protein VTP21DRAFT_7638 [Calcarisporiella thermophila]|uniref:uncharacterized protein n=1 Tax=Calcarisporiella thermophila TaxID=911321 RepID=UPI003744064F